MRRLGDSSNSAYRIKKGTIMLVQPLSHLVVVKTTSEYLTALATTGGRFVGDPNAVEWGLFSPPDNAVNTRALSWPLPLSAAEGPIYFGCLAGVTLLVPPVAINAPDSLAYAFLLGMMDPQVALEVARKFQDHVGPMGNSWEIFLKWSSFVYPFRESTSVEDWNKAIQHWRKLTMPQAESSVMRLDTRADDRHLLIVGVLNDDQIVEEIAKAIARGVKLMAVLWPNGNYVVYVLDSDLILKEPGLFL